MREYCRILLVVMTVAVWSNAYTDLAFGWGTYAISVSASPTRVLCGVGSTITAHVTIDGSPTQGHTISFTVSGLGSVSPTTRITDANGNARVTYTSPNQTYGTSTITGKDLSQSGQPTDDCTVAVFRVTQAPDKIFWFDGGVSPNSQPAGYPLRATLTAQGPTGTFTWAIVAGSGDATLVTNSGSQVTIEAVDESSQENTVQVQLKTNGAVVSGTWPVTVWGPHHLELSVRDQDAGNWGPPAWWETVYHYQTKVAWGNPAVDFPDRGALGVNEQFTPPLNHNPAFPNYNWDLLGDRIPGYFEHVWMDPPSNVHDVLTVEDENPPFANPPIAPGSGTVVDWQGQSFRLGSVNRGSGVLVKSHEVQGYLGYGRHHPPD